MAGGQERILRGRIRTVQATKKITRAMELIAASRIVKAQQRVQAAVPYSEKITEVVRDLAAAGAAQALAAARRARRGALDRVRRDLCRPRAVRRLQRRCPACRRGRGQGRRARRQAVPGDPGRPEGRGVLPVPRLHARRGLRRVQRQPQPRRRQAHRRPRRRAVHERRGRSRRARLHPLRERRQPGGRVAAARPAVGRDGDRRRRQGGSPPISRPATTSSSPTRRPSSRRCCRATSRRASTPPCSTPRRPSTPSASGR